MNPDGPDDPRPLWLDADPRETLGPAQGPRRALGRDPFEEPGAPDPFLARLGLEAEAPQPQPLDAPPETLRRARPPVRPARLPRLEELEPGSSPALLERWLGEEERRRLSSLAHLVEEGQGYDSFGLSPSTLRSAFPPVYALYRYYFRVRSEGHEHLPADGPAILVANHGGLLPFDGAMGIMDVLLHTDPPRLPRALVDRFAGRLPFVNVLFARLGQVVATRQNFRALLRRNQLVWIFPEGVAGIRKPISQRYRLQHFHTGFAQEAVRAGVPIVPVAIVGAEDQAPVIYDVQPLARRLGLPAVPITPTFPWFGPLGLLPYPVSYRIVYGPPLRPAERLGPEAADDERLVEYLAAQVRSTIQRMLDRHR